MIDKVKVGRVSGIRSIKNGLKEYEHIKKNKYFANIKELVAEIRNEMTPCHCRQVDGKGCGPESNCYNRAAQIECDISCCPMLQLQFECLNNRIREHKTIKSEVRDCGEKGLGLFAMEEAQYQTLVEEYVGEVITVAECTRRLDEVYTGEKHKYLMVLHRDLIVDATRRGNYARFINHSCDPNCEVQMWYVDARPRLGIFARRTIKKDEELTLNYNFKRFGNEIVKCYCGSKLCSNVLGKQEVPVEQRKRKLTVGCGYDPITASKIGIAMSDESINEYEASVRVIVCNGTIPKPTANSLREGKVLLVRNILKTAKSFAKDERIADLFNEDDGAEN